MANSKKPPIKPISNPVDKGEFEDDIAKADALENYLNVLAEKSEDDLKPKTINKKEDKWSSLDEVENDAAINASDDDDAWF